jgi:hypothetical protein
MFMDCFYVGVCLSSNCWDLVVPVPLLLPCGFPPPFCTMSLVTLRFTHRLGLLHAGRVIRPLPQRGLVVPGCL